MVKCELRVASCKCDLRVAYILRVTSYKLHLFCELRVASCTYYASCEFELETQKCELKPKLRVACILLKKGLFR